MTSSRLRNEEPEPSPRYSAVAHTECGYIQHNKPSFSVGEDGRIVEVDEYGNKRHDKPQYKVEGSKVYETDPYGRVKQQKFIIKDEQGRSK